MAPAALRFVIIFAAFSLFTAGTNTYCQEQGVPYSDYFAPKDYQASPQNWAALQNQSGVMLFANGEGIMTFDGNRWQVTPMTNNNLVRSLAFGPGQNLFAGGYNEIGILEQDSNRRPSFTSFTHKLKKELREFGHVWSIVSKDSSVYFATDKNILVWRNNRFKVVEGDTENSRAFIIVFQNQIFVQPSGEGLSVLENDTLRPVTGGEFYRGRRITGILSYDSGHMLICTLDNGLFLFDGKRSTPFNTEVPSLLNENRFYKCIELRNGNIAIGTLLDGVIIINKKGELLHHLEKGHGLGDNAVYNLMQDRQGALWVTMSIGISRVELQTPVTFFDERTGLQGAVNDIIRYNNELYAATMLGLFELQSVANSLEPPYFKKKSDVSSSVWGMVAGHGSLLLATDQGTLELKNGQSKFLDDFSGAVIRASSHDPDLTYVGLTDGVVILKFIEGKWHSMGRIPGVEADVGEMHEDVEGNLWLGTFSEGVIQVKFPDASGKRDYTRPQVRHFGRNHGLPVGYVQLNRIGTELLFRVEPHTTLYKFDTEKSAFTRLSLADKLKDYDTTIFPFTSEQANKLWMVKRKNQSTTFDFHLYTSAADRYTGKLIPFSRVQEDVDEVMYMDEMEDGVAWLGGLDGIIRFDYKVTSERNTEINVIINEIKLRNDSTLYSGINSPMQKFDFPYSLNTVAFSFGASSFELHKENEFQYWLEGFDEDWSSWTKETSKSYTQVREGNYTFNIRARNVFGDVSPVVKFEFSISPPWYRHIVAYAFYTLLLFVLIYMLIRARSRQLIREKLALVKIIEERTSEISSKNMQLEQQAEELKTQTEQLKEMDQVKSNFFTNISHEFRTPLSLILAPLERQLSEMPRKTETEMMYRNARKLQNLINQLLDLSKLESGQMKVFLSRNDLTSFIENFLKSFHGLAASKNITFTHVIPDEPTDAYFDSDKLETILNNLLSNAFKFTPDGGKVSFTMQIREREQQCEFTIHDTGPGIPEKEIPKIFDRFYQVDGGVQREFGGSGIGLALTKELVALLHGHIDVVSGTDGSTFRVSIPVSREENAIIPKEIVYSYTPTEKLRENDSDSFLDVESVQADRPTILWVEDNADLRSYLAGVLEKNYRVKTASNGEEALALTLDEIPDLILSDMMMPKMDGFTLCEEIRKREETSHIPFVLLTARSTIESRLAGLELGADDYLTKPFIIAELLIRIKNLLEQRNNLKIRFRQQFRVAPKDITVTSMDEKFLSRVIEVVETNLADATFSVERLSEEVGMSRKHLHRKLVGLVDQTPNEFIRVFRLKSAMQLLEQQSGNVKEVAFGVGFNNLSYFAKCFKEQFGMTPAEVKFKQNSGQNQIE